MVALDSPRWHGPRLRDRAVISRPQLCPHGDQRWSAQLRDHGLSRELVPWAEDRLPFQKLLGGSHVPVLLCFEPKEAAPPALTEVSPVCQAGPSRK